MSLIKQLSGLQVPIFSLGVFQSPSIMCRMGFKVSAWISGFSLCHYLSLNWHLLSGFEFYRDSNRDIQNMIYI